MSNFEAKANSAKRQIGKEDNRCFNIYILLLLFSLCYKLKTRYEDQCRGIQYVYSMMHKCIMVKIGGKEKNT